MKSRRELIKKAQAKFEEHLTKLEEAGTAEVMDVMAIAHFWIFGTLLGVPLKVSSAEFWLMMQIAMLAGFATAYPVNWWLIRVGIKEAM